MSQPSVHGIIDASMGAGMLAAIGRSVATRPDGRARVGTVDGGRPALGWRAERRRGRAAETGRRSGVSRRHADRAENWLGATARPGPLG